VQIKFENEWTLTESYQPPLIYESRGPIQNPFNLNIKEDKKTQYNLFAKLFDDEIQNEIIFQTNLYYKQKTNNDENILQLQDFRVYLGLYLLMDI
jgi:hypothetical protein